TTAQNATPADLPSIASAVLDTKFKLVTGYKGSREVTLAIESGEVQGICGLGYSTVKVQYPYIMNNPFARIFAQEDMHGHPVLNAAGVPMMISLARNDEERAA